MAGPDRRPLTVGGLPGTGTTTACRKLAQVLGMEHHYIGQIFRDMAQERNLTLEAFGRLAEDDPRIDHEIDARQVEDLRAGPVILEGRLSGFLAHREGVPAFKVWFHADPHVRAARIVRREGGDVDQRMAQMRVREESERKRYLTYYGLDLSDLSIYDLVVDTSGRTPMAIVEDVVKAYRRAQQPRRRILFWRR